MVASLLADNVTSGRHYNDSKGQYPLLVDLPTPALNTFLNIKDRNRTGNYHQVREKLFVSPLVFVLPGPNFLSAGLTVKIADFSFRRTMDEPDVWMNVL